MFTSNTDLRSILSDAQLAQVILVSAANRNRAEQFAVAEATSYLNFRYDTDTIFGFEVFDYDQTMAYTTGQIIIDPDAMAYTCIANAPAGAALSDVQYFEAKDGRSAIIVMIVVDLLAYHILSKTGANRITEHIKERYDAALKKLKAIREQKMNPELPLPNYDNGTPEEESTDTMEIISRPKRDNFY